MKYDVSHCSLLVGPQKVTVMIIRKLKACDIWILTIWQYVGDFHKFEGIIEPKTGLKPFKFSLFYSHLLRL